MDDFILNFMFATWIVIIGGGLLVWGLDKLCNALTDLMNLTLADIVGFTVLMLIITVVALNL